MTDMQTERAAMNDDTLLKCPECGKMSRLDDCDVMGADEGHVFCPPGPQLRTVDGGPCGYGVAMEHIYSDECGCGQEFAVEPAIVQQGQMELFA